MTLILDPEKSTYLGHAPLYQSADDPNTYYLDEALTVKVNLYTTGEFKLLSYSKTLIALQLKAHE